MHTLHTAQYTGNNTACQAVIKKWGGRENWGLGWALFLYKDNVHCGDVGKSY